MDYDEVRRYCDASLAHSITIDVREVAEAAGNLRTVTIHDDHSVTIEFQRCADYVQPDPEGGGLKYVGKYESLEAAVLDLEEYLEKAVVAWSNFTSTPYEPRVLDEPDPQANVAYFESLVRARAMRLPVRGAFEIAGIYWRHVALWGEYRRDRLGEETEISLRERGVSEDGDGDVVE
jgi:hypothetical protein